MTQPEAAAILSEVRSLKAELHRRVGASPFLEWVQRLSIIALVAVATWLWGHETRLDDHQLRLALIETTSFSAEDGRALERVITKELAALREAVGEIHRSVAVLQVRDAER